MIPAFFANYRVTLHPPTTRTEMGKKVATFDPADDQVVEGCWIKAGPADETLSDAERAETDFTVSLPPGTHVTRSYQLSFDYGGYHHDHLEVTAPPRTPQGPGGYLDRVVVPVQNREEPHRGQ